MTWKVTEVQSRIQISPDCGIWTCPTGFWVVWNTFGELTWKGICWDVKPKKTTYVRTFTQVWSVAKCFWRHLILTHTWHHLDLWQTFWISGFWNQELETAKSHWHWKQWQMALVFLPALSSDQNSAARTHAAETPVNLIRKRQSIGWIESKGNSLSEITSWMSQAKLRPL